MRAYLFAAALLVAFASPSSAQSWPGFPGPQGSGGGGIQTGDDATLGDVDVDSLTLSTGSFTTVAMDLYANAAIELTPASGSAVTIRGATGKTFTINSLSANLNLGTQGSAAVNVTAAGGFNLTGTDSDGDEVRIGAASPLLWTDGRADNGTGDTFLTRAEANVLRLDGDGSAGTAAKLAVSGIAPMTSGQTLVLYDEGGDAALTVGTTGDATFAGDISKSAAAAFDLSSASSQSITFTPGGSTTRLTLLDSSNAVQCNGNLSSTSGNWNISGFKRATFSYPSGGTEASGNSMHVADNDGATGVATMTLPTPSEGMTFSFYVQDAQEFRVDPAANDKILDVDMTGLADGEYITSSTINSTITIMANGDGDWIVLSKTGTWAEETP